MKIVETHKTHRRLVHYNLIESCHTMCNVGKENSKEIEASRNLRAKSVKSNINT